MRCNHLLILCNTCIVKMNSNARKGATSMRYNLQLKNRCFEASLSQASTKHWPRDVISMSLVIKSATMLCLPVSRGRGLIMVAI